MIITQDSGQTLILRGGWNGEARGHDINKDEENSSNGDVSQSPFSSPRVYNNNIVKDVDHNSLVIDDIDSENDNENDNDDSIVDSSPTGEDPISTSEMRDGNEGNEVCEDSSSASSNILSSPEKIARSESRSLRRRGVKQAKTSYKRLTRGQRTEQKSEQMSGDQGIEHRKDHNKRLTTGGFFSGFFWGFFWVFFGGFFWGFFLGFFGFFFGFFGSFLGFFCVFSVKHVMSVG